MTDDELVLLFQALSPEEALAFITLVRLVLPHRQPELAAARNATALALDATMVTNLGLRAAMLGGIRDLEAAAFGAHRSSFAALSGADQLELIVAQEGSAFFQTLVQVTKYDFYNRHVVWKALGYPDQGNDSGYLDKGFDVLVV